MTDYVMEAKNVYKSYCIKGEEKEESKIVEAVKDVSLQIRKGDIKLIFGPSGSGKSTFFVVWLCSRFQTRVKSTLAMCA
jgi:ABC-type oligopeptide transport system ATPase subunit